jgi:mono/diheme cytochrome c family protein
VLAAAFAAGLGAGIPLPAVAGGAAPGMATVPLPSAQADDRGRALYEARCIACHDRSVHQRSARAATDFAGVRAAVARWDRETGALWRPDEIDAVTRYLNERYYRFPCSGPACPAPRAEHRG